MKRTPLNKISKSEKRTVELAADQLWSSVVLSQTNGRCAKCRKPHAQAAHIIPRRFKHHRHDPQNGLPLCHACHQWADNGDPVAFQAWLAQNYPAKAAFFALRHHKNGPVTRNTVQNALERLKTMRGYQD